MATTIIKCDPASGIVRIVRHTMGKQESQESRDEELRRLHAEERVPAQVLADEYSLPLGYLVTHILDPAKPKPDKRKRKPDTWVIDATKPKRKRGKRVKLVGPKRPQGRPRKAA